MNAASERSRSLWMTTASVGEAGPLNDDLNADVVVVGAGIGGLSAAYELVQAGRTVVVLDRGPLGGGMTARTTAHLSNWLDDYYHEYMRLRGEDEARAYYESQTAAIDRAEEIQRVEGIDCDFARVDGFLFCSKGGDSELLAKEFEVCQQIGFGDVAWAERTPTRSVDSGSCLRFPRQARFHPLKYLAGLVRCLRRDGAGLFAETPVMTVEEANGGVVVKTEAGNVVRAAAAVVATNAPINDWIALHTKLAPYRTYAMALRTPRGSVADGLYWDTEDPYHYVRLQPGADESSDWLIVGGEDHKTGHANDAEARFARLEAWTRAHFPQAGAIEHRWSGQVLEPVDYLPYVGRNPGNANVYVVTGDSGNGMTTGIFAGMLMRDLVCGRANRFAAAYAPPRITLRAAGEYLRENATVVTNLAEYLTPGEVASLEDIAPGEGALIRDGRRKIAAFRDESGQMHLRSAVCSHARCILHWNSFEKCWDCPCHGSHFSVDGVPINGPAIHPLAEVPAEALLGKRSAAS